MEKEARKPRTPAEIVCTNVRNIAMARGMTGKQACAAAKLSKSYSTLLLHPERFNPTLDVLEKLAGALKCRIADFFVDGLKIDEFGDVPPDMKEYSVMLTPLQKHMLDETLEYNKRRIAQYRAERKARYEELDES